MTERAQTTGGSHDRIAVRGAAALAAGFGGLAFESAAVRRFGLLLGNTSEAATVVLAAFLVGLGAGGAIAWRRGFARPLRAAAVAYGAVALGLLAAERATAGLTPLGWGLGVAVAAVAVGGPAVLMGIAFPLLFGGIGGRRAPGLLVALNLLGSVLAAWLAGNLLVPLLGITRTLWCGASAYAVAAALIALGGRGFASPGDAAPAVAPRRALPAGAPRLAFASGLLVVGLQLVLLRRLPFFLEGFQPTLSGVLATCLCALAAGGLLAAWLARRGDPLRRAAAALCVAAVGSCLGLHEWVVPAVARWEVTGDLGLHGRILAATAIAAGPALVAAGTVVPLAVGAAAPADRGAAAGGLFLAQGVGSLAGALLVGHVLPALAPASLFATALPVLALAGVVGAVHRAPPAAAVSAFGAVVLLTVLGVAGAGTPWDPRPPVVGSRFDRPDAYVPIEHRSDSVTTASVVYDRAHHSMVLFTDEFRAAYTGPGTSYMKVLGHLPFLLRDDLRDVAVVALGTGTTADAVRAWPDPRVIDVVEISPAVLAVVDRFAGDGPVPTRTRAPFAVDPRTRVHVDDGRRWLAGRAPGSLDLVTMEPLLPYAPGTAALYSREFYEVVRARLREDGLCVQWVPTHAMPRAMFETLLGTFADVFASTSVWLVDQSTLLVGSRTPHLPPPGFLEARLAAAPELAARTLHEAGITGLDDLLAAHVAVPESVFPAAARLGDDRPFLERIGYWSGAERLAFYPGNLEALEELCAAVEEPFGGADWTVRRRARLVGLAARAAAVLDPGGQLVRDALTAAAGLRGDVPGSVLLHHEETLALRAMIEQEVRRMPPTSAAVVARGHVERDDGSAALVALTGADAPPGSAGAQRALQTAIALDPTAPEHTPWAFAWAGAAVPAERRSPLEDVGVLPDGAALAELAARDDVRGASIRAVFGVRCARALVGVVALRAWTAPERAAFRIVADPCSLEAAADAVAARGGDPLVEVAAAWRRDLPLPAAFAALRSGATAARAGLAEALGGRKDRAAVLVLADLLEDADDAVRRNAAVALFRTFGDAIAYDPHGPESERTRAANRLRALHNRRP